MLLFTFLTFCQFLLIDTYLGAENFTNTCQHARFWDHRHDYRINFTSQEARPYEGVQEMGTKVLLSHRIFYELQPPINTDKTRNLSKMCFLLVKEVERDTQ